MWWIGAALATTHEVGTTHASLEEALLVAQDGDQIVLPAGAHVLSGPLSTSLDLVGLPGAMLEVPQSPLVLDAPHLRLHGLDVAPDSRLDVRGTHLVLEDVALRGSQLPLRLFDGAYLEARDLRFDGPRLLESSNASVRITGGDYQTDVGPLLQVDGDLVLEDLEIAASGFDGNANVLATGDVELTGVRFDAARVAALQDLTVDRSRLFGSTLVADRNTVRRTELVSAETSTTHIWCDATCQVDRSWLHGPYSNIWSGADAHLTRSLVCEVDPAGPYEAASLVVAPNALVANAVIGGGTFYDLVRVDNAILQHNTIAGVHAASGVTASWAHVTNNALFDTDTIVATLWGINFETPVLAVDTLDTYEFNAWGGQNVAQADYGGSSLAAGPQGLHWASSCDEVLTVAAAPSLVDAGSPGVDADGSARDIGAFGGPDGDRALFADADGDGVYGMLDCDDADPTIPRAIESCAGVGIDEDCDGLVDGEDPFVEDGVLLHLDRDGDGLGDPVLTRVTCPGPGVVDNALDTWDGPLDSELIVLVPAVEAPDAPETRDTPAGAACGCATHHGAPVWLALCGLPWLRRSRRPIPEDARLM